MYTIFKFISIITVCWVVILGSSSVYAQTEVFSDDFSQELIQWRPLRDDGQFWKVVNGALEAYIPVGFTLSELIPKATFPEGIQNFEYSFDMTPLSGFDKNIAFGLLDTKNWYDIHFSSNFAEFVKLQNNTVMWSFRYPFVMTNGKTYKILLSLIEGEISLFIDSVKVFSQLDPLFTKYVGNIALRASTGSVFPTKILFDNVKLTALPSVLGDTILQVNLLKQTDPAWSDREYDTANFWTADMVGASATFKDWACNLMSQVMLLNYHGITTLPDGSALNPISYNDWLLANRGYLNSPHTGNINRLSMSQLSALVSQKLGTPKLEFRYVSENIIETAIAEIENGNPVILELDGHFVVADGFTHDKTDLLIKDPAYNVSRLSQHPLKVKSLRLYSPSQTDLSYISVVSSPTVEVKITNDHGELLPAVIYQEQLKSFTDADNQTAPASKVTEIVKPLDGTYTITLSAAPDGSQKPVKIEVYQQDGSSEILYQSENFDKEEKRFLLMYSKNDQSQLQAIAELKNVSLLQKIKELHQQRDIKSDAIANTLMKFAGMIETSSELKQSTLLTVIKKLIQVLPERHVTELAKQELTDSVNHLLRSLK